MHPSIRLFMTDDGLVLEQSSHAVRAAPGLSLDILFAADNPMDLATRAFASGTAIDAQARSQALASPRPPVQSQEIWAAGVTYLRSKTARMAEAKGAGGGSFYDRVYEAERPELFFKATPHRVAAPGSPVRIRRDSRWNVPEPELTLAIDARGRIFGYTVGNDMSSRDIEGENPLYLPQAKVYDRSVALGPCLVLSEALPDAGTTIAIEIQRGGSQVFKGETSVDRIKRPLPSLAEWLYRESSFPFGCYLMTGTGIVPPDDFTLRAGDVIRITIPDVGTLVNTVEVAPT